MKLKLTLLFLISILTTKADFVNDSIQAILSSKNSDSVILLRLTMFGRNLKHEPAKAIEVLTTLRKFSEKKTISKRDLASCYRKIGTIYIDLNNPHKALEYTFMSLKLSEELNDKKSLASCYNNIANYYQNINAITGDTLLLNKSLKFHLKNINLRKELNDTNWLYMAYNNAGITYTRLKQYDEAIRLLNIGYNFYKNKKGAEDALYMIYANLGDVYFYKALQDRKTENFNKALFYFNNYLNYKSTKNLLAREDLANANENIGQIYFETGQHSKSLELLNEAFSIYKQINNHIGLNAVSLKLAQVNEKLGYYEKANFYYKLHLAFKDSLMIKNNNSNFEKMEIDRMLNEKENEILSIKKDNEKQAAVSEIDHKRKNVILISIAVGLISLLIFSIFIFNRFKITQKQKSIIEKQKTIVEEQKKIVEHKQKEVMDSIQYARRIQNSLLPTNKYIERILNKNNKTFKC